MGLWIAMAVLTAAVLVALLVPLYRSRAGAMSLAGPPANTSEIAIYRDQLEEISRDVERGVLAPAEAEAARTEISRRLLKADDQIEGVARQSPRLARAIAAVAIVAIPLGSVGAYLLTGEPDRPDMPLASRNPAQPNGGDIALLEWSFQTFLTGQTDGRALAQALDDAIARYPEVAPQLLLWRSVIYARDNNLDEAGRAYLAAVAIDPAVDRTGAVGRALGPEIVISERRVSDLARDVFEAVVRAVPNDAMARVYLAGRLSEDGKITEAIAAWRAILDIQPPVAPELAALVRQELVRLDPTIQLPPDSPSAAEPEVAAAPGGIAPVPREPGPNQQQIDAAAGMTPEQRQEMVAGMVDQLAERLESEPNDPDGWARLIRSYMVLGRADDAQSALARARTALAGQADALTSIEAEARAAGVN